MTSVLVLGKNSLASGGIRYSLLFLTTTKLTGMNIIAIKSKVNNFSLLHGLTLNPHHDTYICFIGRNLDSRTTMLEDHESQ